MKAEHPPKCRHVWVDYSNYRWPGLIIAWRRADDRWQANVAIVKNSSVLVSWQDAADLHPIQNDGWINQSDWTRGPYR